MQLWIAFKIVSLFTIRNYNFLKQKQPRVVNCFQNCIFIYYSQLISFNHFWKFSCELLSKLYLYLLFATIRLEKEERNQLWIAFKIVSLFTIRNFGITNKRHGSVVNCFQNCIFIYYSQPSVALCFSPHSCELLSKLYLYLLFATVMFVKANAFALWIAFKIVSLFTIRNANLSKGNSR